MQHVSVRMKLSLNGIGGPLLRGSRHASAAACRGNMACRCCLALGFVVSYVQVSQMACFGWRLHQEVLPQQTVADIMAGLAGVALLLCDRGMNMGITQPLMIDTAPALSIPFFS